MNEWHILVVGAILGTCLGVLWAFDFETERLMKGIGRVVVGSVAGLVIALLGSLYFKLRMRQR